MAYYASSADFYTATRALFERMLAEGRLNQMDARLRLYVNVTDPTAHILINSRVSPPQVNFGTVPGPFDLEVTLSADTLHAMWTSRLGVRASLGQGLLKVKGNPLKALALKPVFDQAKLVYPAILAEQGRAP